MDEQTLLNLRKRGDDLFRRSYNQLSVVVADEYEALRLTPAVTAEDGTETLANLDTAFSIFLPAHEGTVRSLVADFKQIVDSEPNEAGLEAVLDQVETLFIKQNSDLLKFALSVFITNDPIGRNLYIPRVVEQSPEKFIPAHPDQPPSVINLGGLGQEAKLDYFREDPDYNGHHEQWHRVYEAGGDPKDRQGELFWYMHQQMLARYDTERLSNGLPPAIPFTNFRDPIPEGYQPEAIIAGRYIGRPIDRSITNIRFPFGVGDAITVADLEDNRERLLRFAREGQIVANGHTISLTPDSRGATRLGALLEASRLAVNETLLQGKEAAYFGMHNMGHVFFATIARSPQRGGVMGDTTSAVRDPVFYRWHRLIDDIFVTWQNQLPPNDLAAQAPNVLLRKDGSGVCTDIGLSLLRDIAPDLQNGTDFDGTAQGEAWFGGVNWEHPLSQIGQGKLTDTLETTIKRYDLTIPQTGETYTVHHLDHEEFVYFFRIENRDTTSAQVTARVFIAPSEKADDRRSWIEMDKFVIDLLPEEKKVVYQPARLSSVVRKAARRPGEGFPGPDEPNDDYCKCGWPYHMLLPRGTEDGMSFRLMVILTDAIADLPEAASRCGSVSFCGARDLRYPDNRMMGYPFDRPFETDGISKTLANPNLPHVGARDFTIRHIP